MRVLDIIIKDLKVMLRDKKALAITLLMPIILMTILGFALQNTFTSDSGNNEKFNIAVVKNYDAAEDKKMLYTTFKNLSTYNDEMTYFESGEISFDVEKIFFEEFLENEELKKYLQYEIKDMDEAEKLLENKKIDAVVVLPERFVYNMGINVLTPFRNKVNIEVIGHPDKYITTNIINNIMQGFADKMSSIIVSKNVVIEKVLSEDLPYEVLNNLDKIIGNFVDNINEDGEVINYIKVNKRKPLSSFDYNAVGMATMFILFIAGQGGLLLLEEKENITYDRMSVAGISKWEIITGKFFTLFISGLLQIFIMILYSSTVLKVDWGNKVLVLLVTICTVFSVAGLGMLISTIAFKYRKSTVSDVFQSVVVQFMALIGGSFIPVNILPEFVQKLNKFVINGIALNSYIKIMYGYGLEEIKTSMILLVIIGIVLITISIFIFSQEERYKDDKHIKIKAVKIER